MKRFLVGADRGQSTLLPECLDEWIDESNPVRAVDAFVDALDLGKLGFEGVVPEVTGRPSYHPSALLKLYCLMCRRLLNPQYLAFPPPFAMDSRRPRVRRLPSSIGSLANCVLR